MSTSSIPFLSSLDSSLSLQHDHGHIPNLRLRNPPSSSSSPHTLPGQPYVPLTHAAIEPYLRAELLTPELDAFSTHLWLVATASSAHVSPLHEHVARGRVITPIEDPERHLVWHADRVFVKPIPRWLTSREVWECYLVPRQSDVVGGDGDESRRALGAAARGFLRSYSLLVRHESDFAIARQAGLVPAMVGWEEFVSFLAGFRSVVDAEVSPRFRYGDLRLSRLNLWARLFIGRWNFRDVTWSYSVYFTSLYGPIIFVFAVLSVILSCMQVILTGPTLRTEWEPRMENVFRWFSIATLTATAVLIAGLISTFIALVLNESIFAVKAQVRIRLGKAASSDESELSFISTRVESKQQITHVHNV